MRLSESLALPRLPALQPGERLIAAYRPSPRWFLPRYLATFGGYEAWRRATVYAVTDRRVLMASGRVGRDCHSVDLRSVRDLDLRHRLWGSRVSVASAAAERVGELLLTGLGAAEATELWEQIGRARHAASGAEASVAAQLAELAALRQAGHLSEAEFAAAKRRTLGAVEPPAPARRAPAAPAGSVPAGPVPAKPAAQVEAERAPAVEVKPAASAQPQVEINT